MYLVKESLQEFQLTLTTEHLLNSFHSVYIHLHLAIMAVRNTQSIISLAKGSVPESMAIYGRLKIMNTPKKVLLLYIYTSPFMTTETELCYLYATFYIAFQEHTRA